MTIPETGFSDLSDAQLTERIVQGGSALLLAAQERLAAVGALDEDDRWDAPVPLRFEPQLAYLFLGAIDAFDVTIGLLKARASQQAFNTLRFQLESLALIRWMTQEDDVREQQRRAYKVVSAELRRFEEILVEDAGDDPEALADVENIKHWRQRLATIAESEGINRLGEPPSRRDLIGPHGETSGYPTWRMLSELGSHPPAPGLTLLLIQPDSRQIDYDLSRPSVARAFFAASSIFYFWQTCETVATAMGWDEWLNDEARGLYLATARPNAEALRRRQQARSPGVPPTDPQPDADSGSAPG